MNAELASRYQLIMRRISAVAGGAGRVTLIAVSKGQPPEAVEALYSIGHRDFGENYVQELTEKASRLAADGCRDIRWHFIGHLQTNKVKAVVPYLHSVHSVDSERLAAELAKRWGDARSGVPLPCFLEVNLAAEPSKTGVTPDAAPALAAAIAGAHPSLRLEGLMAVPPADLSPEQATARFVQLRELELKCRPHTRGRLSMGMSSDYELAIPQGSTHVRIGTALFGPRHP